MSGEAGADAELGRLAERQHGVVSRAQAARVGLSTHAVRRRVRSGRWRAVLPGVYAIVGSVDRPQQRLAAACLYVGPGAVVSHRSAAWLWQLDGVDAPPRPEVTVVGDTGRRRPGVLVHRSDSLPRAEVARLDGVAVTRPARTLLDLAGCVADGVLVAARDDARRRRLVHDRIEAACLARHGERHPRGIARLRALHVADLGLPAPASGLERVAIDALVRHGLPAPVRQHRIRVPGVRPALHLDLAYPDRRIGIEVQSYRWHTDRRAWSRDTERANGATAIGWSIFAATHHGLADGGASFAALVMAAYHRAA